MFNNPRDHAGPDLWILGKEIFWTYLLQTFSVLAFCITVWKMEKDLLSNWKIFNSYLLSLSFAVLDIYTQLPLLEKGSELYKWAFFSFWKSDKEKDIS